MLVNGTQYTSIWRDEKSDEIRIIDQRKLPYEFEIVALKDLEASMVAIRDMYVRGAPLIGVTAAYGFSLAMLADSSDQAIDSAFDYLTSARPTAVNLRWACRIVANKLKSSSQESRVEISRYLAKKIADDDVEANTRIGKFGSEIIHRIAEKKRNGDPVRILTHCNAGWLATVDRGTATAPIYEAKQQGIDLEVWVDETRPRNQGAALTSWEFQHNKIKNTLIVDNAGGHLMQIGMIDAVIVGSDRTTCSGNVCNKIGTYLKALAAWDNNVPFYAALPVSTIDFEIDDAFDIPIEVRDENEVLKIAGTTEDGTVQKIKLTIDGVGAFNPAFDVTPAKYVTGIITDKGVVAPTKEAIQKIKP